MHFVTEKSQNSSLTAYIISLTSLCFPRRMGETVYNVKLNLSSNTLEGKKTLQVLVFHHWKEFLLRQVTNQF